MLYYIISIIYYYLNNIAKILKNYKTFEIYVNYLYIYILID